MVALGHPGPSRHRARPAALPFARGVLKARDDELHPRLVDPVDARDDGTRTPAGARRFRAATQAGRRSFKILVVPTCAAGGAWIR